MGNYVPLPLRWSSYISYLEFFYRGDLFVLHLSICSVIYSYQYGLTHIYFILWVIIQSDFIYCFSSSFGHWERFQLAPVPRPPHPIRAGIYLFLSTFLLSGTRCSRIISCISCPKPRIRYFSRKLWFFFLGSGSRDQDLGARCARCYWSGPHLFLFEYPDSFIHSVNYAVWYLFVFLFITCLRTYIVCFTKSDTILHPQCLMHRWPSESIFWRKKWMNEWILAGN